MQHPTIIRRGIATQLAVHAPHGAFAAVVGLLGAIAVINVGVDWGSDWSRWPWHLGCALITMLATGWFASVPNHGCYAIITLSVADFLFGGIAFVPMLLLALLAVGFIGYSDLIEATLAGIALLGAIVLSPYAVAFPTINNNLLSFPCLVALTLCVSTLIRKNGEQQRHMQREQTLLANAGIAQNLHDYTTNDLSDIVMMAEHQLSTCEEGQREVWSNIRAMALDALTHTRKAILTLEDDKASIRQDGTAPSSQSDTGNALRELDEVIHACRGNLAAGGFSGDVIRLGTEPSSIDGDTAVLTLGLIRELFGNIAKHADPSGRYTMLIAWSAGSCSIDLSDKPKPNAGAGLHSGLERYRKTVEAIHGQWAVERSADRWDFHAAIPLQNATGEPMPKPGNK